MDAISNTAMEAVNHVNRETIRDFAKRRLNAGETVVTDGLAALKCLNEHHCHLPQNTPPEKAHECLPWVHLVISNFKRFILGTFHGVSGKYLQEYLNEFCYRFNRRHCESELPARLLGVCATHLPVKFG